VSINVSFCLNMKINIHTLLFYGPLFWTTWVGQYLKRQVPEDIILDFKRRGEQRQVHWESGWMPPHPDHRCPHLHHPPVLHRMPFLHFHPSQFILAWDGHQICWTAYLKTWQLNNEIKWIRLDKVISLTDSLNAGATSMYCQYCQSPKKEKLILNTFRV